MIIKCKMCGGDLSFEAGSSVCECEYCGSRQTIPNADNEKKANLFNRANRLRIGSEFDKAAAVYETIVAEFPGEAEAYWGLCLCAYGIEYVDDPATGRKLPTCHRTLTAPIMEDGNFEQACDNADAVARRVYRDEAKAIDRIQKDILSIAANEAPYDVFICYKEKSGEGGRTEDSVLAQEIYDALTVKGLKVFFSRITLEDKLGVQYEPYIYAALSSAKVMLAIGTQFEYYDAVWVKNEWSRFLSMMKTDRSKTLIPCFRGLDAYDMPGEFKGLQAQDMGKIGWLQDLVRGVEKLCGAADKAMVRETAQSSIASNLMKRVYLFLEDGDFEQAREYIGKVLDTDAEYAPAYVANVLVQYKLRNESELESLRESIDTNPDWIKALRFADARQRKTYEACAQAINCKKVYAEALIALRLKNYPEAITLLNKTGDYKYSRSRLSECIGLYRPQLAEEIYRAMIKIKKKESIATEINDLTAELSQVRGFLSGGKKRELQARIDDLKCELSDMELTINENPSVAECAQKQLMKYGKEINASCAKPVRAEEMIKSDLLRELSDDVVIMLVMQAPPKKACNDIVLGHYPQTASGADSTPIEWIVLEVRGNKALLISRYGIEAQLYNDAESAVTWEKCTLRALLNGEFLNKAFSSEEQKAILTTTVDNSKSQCCSVWSTSGGNNTQDRLFLLSYSEAYKYFGVTMNNCNNKKSRVQPTAYAIKQGAYKDGGSKTADGGSAGWWWLRSPGSNQISAALVDYDGSLDYSNVDYDIGCVRPALWLNLESEVFLT